MKDEGGKTVLVIAGEISGDMHAASLVRAARAKRPDVQFFGIGGDALRAAGMEILYDAKDMAVLGLSEVLRRLGFFKRVFKDMVRVAVERKPDAVLLIDYPGFNLRFAREMKRRGIKVIYYVCPQVWAWHRSRVPQMARIIDRLLVIFPFEVDVFSGTGLRVDFVGHPLVDEAARIRNQPVQLLPWPGAPRIALLPGSRKQEIERIFPLMWDAALELGKRMSGVGFIVAAASPAMADLLRSYLDHAERKTDCVQIVEGATREVLRQAHAAMVASGTATVDTALMGCPMIVVYKTAWLTWLFGRLLIRVPHLGMVNLLAGRELCPEFIQRQAKPGALALAVEKIARDTPERAAMLKGLEEVRVSLGSGGAAERAAECLLDELGR